MSILTGPLATLTTPGIVMPGGTMVVVNGVMDAYTVPLPAIASPASLSSYTFVALNSVTGLAGTLTGAQLQSLIGGVPVATIGVPSVSGLVAGGTTTFTGTYANGTPTGLTYSILGGAPVTVSSPTIGGGTYSFSIATPTAGTYLITITGTGGNTATSSSVGFTTAAAGSPSIGIPSVSGLTVGGTTTLTGSYANGTPTGLTYSLDSGAAVAATSPTISGGNYSFTVTTPTAGAHNVTVTGTGPNTATSAAASFTTAAAGNNAAFYTVRKTPGQTGSGVTTLSVSGIASTGTANMTPGNLDVVDGGGSPIGQAAYITLGASSTAVPVGAAAGGDFAIHNQDYGATSLTNSPNTYTSATAMYIFANGHAAGTTRTLYWWIVQNADRTKGGVLCDSGGVPIPFTANY